MQGAGHGGGAAGTHTKHSSKIRICHLQINLRSLSLTRSLAKRTQNRAIERLQMWTLRSAGIATCRVTNAISFSAHSRATLAAGTAQAAVQAKSSVDVQKCGSDGISQTGFRPAGFEGDAGVQRCAGCGAGQGGRAAGQGALRCGRKRGARQGQARQPRGDCLCCHCFRASLCCTHTLNCALIVLHTG